VANLEFIGFCLDFNCVGFKFDLKYKFESWIRFREIGKTSRQFKHLFLSAGLLNRAIPSNFSARQPSSHQRPPLPPSVPLTCGPCESATPSPFPLPPCFSSRDARTHAPRRSRPLPYAELASLRLDARHVASGADAEGSPPPACI
jgi:hypothetical protein